MAIWALADLHLAFGVPNKDMAFFGPTWERYTEKIFLNWNAVVSNQDLILIPGDISWGLRLEEAQPDLEWLGRLPGTKLLLRGNHDLWWSSLAKIKTILPASCYLLQNDSFVWGDAVIGGTRLWDSQEYSFGSYIEYRENSRAKSVDLKPSVEENQKIFNREIGRLETSLRSMDKNKAIKIVMTHYPPISAMLEDSIASHLFEKHQIQHVLFGHLHNVRKETPLFGIKKGISYHLVSADYLDFKPLLIC